MDKGSLMTIQINQSGLYSLFFFWLEIAHKRAVIIFFISREIIGTGRVLYQWRVKDIFVAMLSPTYHQQILELVCVPND